MVAVTGRSAASHPGAASCQRGRGRGQATGLTRITIPHRARRPLRAPVPAPRAGLGPGRPAQPGAARGGRGRGERGAAGHTRAARAWPRAPPCVGRARGAGAPAARAAPAPAAPASWSGDANRCAGPRRAACVYGLFWGLSNRAARRVPRCCLPPSARRLGRHTQPSGIRTQAWAACTKSARVHCLSTARVRAGPLCGVRALLQGLQFTCSRAGGARAAAAAAGHGARRGARGERRLWAAVHAAAPAAAAAAQAAARRTSPGRGHGRVGLGRRPAPGRELGQLGGLCLSCGAGAQDASRVL